MQIDDKTDSLVVQYPWCDELLEKQQAIFWTADEVAVEKDKQDLLVEMTDAERLSVIEVLRLFSLYELRAGSNYWLGRIMREYSRPEVRRMASMFGMMELAVHEPFYRKLNDVLLLTTDEFFNAYKEDKDMSERMDYIGSMVGHDNIAISLASFALVEGAVLYSSFAFLKHFSSCGKNLMQTVVRGINFSVRDEAVHLEAGARLFRTHIEEHNIVDNELEDLHTSVRTVARTFMDQERHIMAKVFSHGDIDGAKLPEYIAFAESRIDTVLARLGIDSLFNVAEKDNTVAEWFYNGINGYASNDSFAGIGSGYVRGWDEEGFAWIPTYSPDAP